MDRALLDLTGVELDVLHVLWERKSCSAREAHEQLSARHGWAYSTTRTVLERMVKKGLLSKAPFHGLNLYQPAVSKAAGLAAQVRDFADRVLGSSDWSPLVSLFADTGKLTEEELGELEALLVAAEDER